MAGKTLTGMIHICDFYATFSHLAGLNPNDTSKDAPAPIDSINMWPYLTGQVTESPRNIIVHDHLMYTTPTNGAIRQGKYKLIKQKQSDASWYGQFSPNQSWTSNSSAVYACSANAPCLFDIENDVTEHHDLSKQLPDVVQQLTELFNSYNNQYHPPKNSPPNQQSAWCSAIAANKGFVVPWVKSNSTTKHEEL